MLHRLGEIAKPFAAGAILAVAGGWIGLFCSFLAAGLQTGRLGPALAAAITAGFNLVFLLTATYLALYGTLLLPFAYYATRRKVEVTPGRYAGIGGGLAVGILLVYLIWTSTLARGPLSPALAEATRYTSIGMAIGTLLAGAVCGALFGWMVRGHYERYRLTGIERA